MTMRLPQESTPRFGSQTLAVVFYYVVLCGSVTKGLFFLVDMWASADIYVSRVIVNRPNEEYRLIWGIGYPIRLNYVSIAHVRSDKRCRGSLINLHSTGKMTDQTASHVSFLLELDGFLRTNNFEMELPAEECEGTDLLANAGLLLLASDDDDALGTDSSSCSDISHQQRDSRPNRSRKRVAANKKRSGDSFRAKETKRRRVYRQRLKSERETLQHELTKLTDQLTKLTQRLVKQTTETNVVSSVSTWKALAKCEQQDQRQAMEDQKNLTAAVSAQASLIQELKAVVLNRLEVAPSIDQQVFGGRVMVFRKDAVLFGTQISELDANYARTDAVLGGCGVGTMSTGSTISVFKNTADGSVKYFQYLGKKSSPLKFEQACKNFWNLAHIKHRQQDRALFDRARDLENTFAVRFRAVAELEPGISVSLLQRLVVRRFVTDNHMVVVWRIFIEGEGAYSGMHATNSGWCRLQRDLNGSEAGTLMEICVHQTPMHFTLNPSDSKVSQFHDAIIKISKENDEKFQAGMESVPLDDTRLGPIGYV